MANGLLQITSGSTNYSFELAGPVTITKKPDSGEILKTVAVQRRADQLDAPWSMTDWSGIGTSRAVESQKDADNRLWEMKNIQWWPGCLSLGPAGRTTTDVTGTRRTVGFFQFRNNFFSFADVAGSVTTETLEYWQTTGTWADCTATADFNTTVGSNVGFPCVGMADQDGVVYALRTVFNAPGARYQLQYSSDGTTWTAPNHVNAADCPGPVNTINCWGLISILGVLYTATLDSSNRILLRQNAAGNNGVTWTTTATSKESVSAINGLIAYFDYAGVFRPWVLTPEGAFLWDGTSFYKAVDHINKWGQNETNTGKNPVIWNVENIEGGYLAYPQGRNLLLVSWGNNNTPIPNVISPTYNTQGLPSFRDGQITCLASVNNYIMAGIGGDSASTTAGVYSRPSQFIHPLGWFGPFYDVGTANRQVRAMAISSYNDGIVRLHVAMDNGTSNDTDLIYMDNITSDPRTVSSYLHTSATGTIILPKNDRFLPEQNKIWRKIEIIGTNLSSTNKVSALYASADAAPLDSSGSWGSTLGSITANAGTVNFSGTPAGTGQSARGIQIRLDLTGTSNASPYIEGINVYVKTLLAVKYIRKFPIAPTWQGSTLPMQTILRQLEAIAATTTDLAVVYGEETTALIMEPWRNIHYSKAGLFSSPFEYQNEIARIGTGNDTTVLESVDLTLVDV